MGIHPKYLNDLPVVSPMGTGKKDAEGEPIMDMTPEEATAATARLAMEKTEKEAARKADEVTKANK